jgi:hypothetical protein
MAFHTALGHCEDRASRPSPRADHACGHWSGVGQRRQRSNSPARCSGRQCGAQNLVVHRCIAYHTHVAKRDWGIANATIDVPIDLHIRLKTGCAMRGEKIADVVRVLIEREFPPQS